MTYALWWQCLDFREWLGDTKEEVKVGYQEKALHWEALELAPQGSGHCTQLLKFNRYMHNTLRHSWIFERFHFWKTPQLPALDVQRKGPRIMQLMLLGVSRSRWSQSGSNSEAQSSRNLVSNYGLTLRQRFLEYQLKKSRHVLKRLSIQETA